MMPTQIVTALPSDVSGCHLLSWPDSPRLLQAGIAPALLSQLMQHAEKRPADCRFGCAPFARLTLLPAADSATLAVRRRALLEQLRVLAADWGGEALLLDVSGWDLSQQAERDTLQQLLVMLLNEDYRLADLGYATQTEARRRPSGLTLWCQAGQESALASLLAFAQACSSGMIAARRLADEPSDSCTPERIVSHIQAHCATLPALSCEVLDEQQIRQQGLGALHAVGKGASNPPRLLILRYQGQGATAPVALVGKGVTFDTGGLWLKSGDGMYTMKYDMCGAAAVYGTLIAAAQLAIPVNLIGVLALAENMIGPDAMRPGDVVTGYGGQTVEINNTDAEGRLVLADALAWAAARHPRIIIDVATLTGAIVKALGYDISGMMGNDPLLQQRLLTAGLRCGDEVWSLPLDERFSGQVKSAIADLCNTPTNNAAIAISAAYFLSRFCPDIPWAHLDVSGTALWREQGRSVASGRPIPLLLQYLLDNQE